MADPAPPADAGARDRSEWLHDEIRTRICLLDYVPGARLSETELAAEFGISRTPLRRVLGRLEDEGLLQSVHGVGTFVTEVNIDELEQTFHLRMELAELGARLSPVMPDAALMAEFQALSVRSKALLGSPAPRDFAQLVTDFFLALLQLTGNAPLREASERLFFQTTRIWLKSVSASVIDLVEEVQIHDREIDGIRAALSIGDLHAAALLQRAHISMSYKRMKPA